MEGDDAARSDPPDPPEHDLALPDLDDLMPEISFDFQTRGDDNDTTINDSQEPAPEIGNFVFPVEDDEEERALQALLQIGDVPPAADTLEAEQPPGELQVEEPPGELAAQPAALNGEPTPHDTREMEDAIGSAEVPAEDTPELRANPVRIEISFPVLSDEQRAEYVRVESDVVESVNGENITEAGAIFYKVEFTDGREDLLSHDTLSSKANGLSALERYYNPEAMSSLGKRKRLDDDEWTDPDSLKDSVDVDEDDEDVHTRRRGTRSRSSRLVSKRQQQPRIGQESDEDSIMMEAPRRSNRARKPPPSLPSAVDDMDELQANPFEDEESFPIIRSDVTASKPMKSRRITIRRSIANSRPRATGDDIDYEAPRRSNRATKYTLDMMDDADMDEESFYVPDEKSSAAPKVISIREVFPPVEATSDFAKKHNKTCHVCKNKHQPLIYCQGCSLSFHKNCIGYRAGREHTVTKVGDGNFVLQCKYCIGLYRKKDDNAPRFDMCQDCKGKGTACAAFSEKKSARQEEKLREENDGVDPITPVSPSLINNASLVLFRCVKCHRGWHTKHLPPTGGASSEDPDERFKDYAVDWKCNECSSTTKKIHRLVAWRPADREDVQSGTQASQFDEDSKEYLVKWEDRSYNHCVWKAGAWIFGVSSASMRKAFFKRDSEKSLMHIDTEDAIPEEYLMPDIILAMKWSRDAPYFETKSDELQNMSYVKKIYVKYQGLGYDDVVWDSPPSVPPKAEQTSDDLAHSRAMNIYNAMGEAFYDYLEGKHFKHESQRKIKDRVRQYKNSKFTELDHQPAGLTGGKLMGYQIEGLNWLLENYHRDRSVVLADEMGLGKTVQVVSLVASLAQDEPKCWPFLVVVPNATCPNWRREFKKWTPDLRVVAFHGGRQAQDIAYKYELFPDGSDEMRAHVVIMSYDSAADPRTKTLFKNIQWQGLVVDEGQRLKNDSNLLYLALKDMRIPFRLLLTGTPLQNNKRELFNLLQFIDQSQDAAKLDLEFEVLDKETLPKLHEKIRPYFLRRTKAGVLKFLPPMAQIILPVTMTSIQEKLSKSIMAKNPQLIKSMFANSKMKAKERGSLNNILMQLRKCLCHPFVYSDAIEERHHDAVVLHRNLVEASSKLILLELMLPKLKERGHRVLIFSQFLQQLDIVEDFLSGMNFGFRRLDGQISSLEKQKRIDAFNAPDSELFAFLLSTRAGGVGINLATADTVIIMDPDFNPHQDIQALSRAHRIGQKQKVLCFQLVTKDSVEERIMQIGRKKMALDHALIESMDDDDLAGDDLESILKHGAQALFADDHQKSAIVYDSASVDKILDRTQIEKTEVTEDGSGDTQFAHARVWANEKSAFQGGLGNEQEEAPEVQVNPNVWERIIAQREEEARKQAEADREVLGRGARRRTAVGNYTAVGPDSGLANKDAASEDSSDAYSSNSGDESDEDDAAGTDGQAQAAFEAENLRAKPEKGSRSKTLKPDANSDEATRRKRSSRFSTSTQAEANASSQRLGQGERGTKNKTNGAGSQPQPNFTGRRALYTAQQQGPGSQPTNRVNVPKISSHFGDNVSAIPVRQTHVPTPQPMGTPVRPPQPQAQPKHSQQNGRRSSEDASSIGGVQIESIKSQAQLRLALDYVARANASAETKESVRTKILRRLRDVSTVQRNRS